MGPIGVTIAVSYVVAKEGKRLADWLGKQGIPGVGNINLPAGQLPGFARAAVAQGMSLSKFVEAAGIAGFSSDAAAAAYNAATRSSGRPGLTGPAGRPQPSLTGPTGVPSVNVPGRVAGATFQNPALSAAQARAIGLASNPNNLALLRAQAAGDQNAIAFAAKLRESGRISNAKYVRGDGVRVGSAADEQHDRGDPSGRSAENGGRDEQAAAEKTKAAADAAKTRRGEGAAGAVRPVPVQRRQDQVSPPRSTTT